MNKNNIDKLKRYLFSEKSTKDYCLQNNMSDEDIISAFVPLSIYKEAMEICSNCSGNDCLSKTPGNQVKLTNKDGKIGVVYYDCPKSKKTNQGNFEVMNYSETSITFEETSPRRSLMKYLSRFIDEYFTNDKKGLVKGVYLHGKCGTGKSLLMYRFAQNLVSQGASVLFAYYPDLVRELQNAIGTPRLEELVLKLKQTDIVFIDDIGREANTPYIRDEILGPVLQYRVDNQLPMFMTSNRSFNLLESHLSETSSIVDNVKGRALIERLKYLMSEYELVDKDFRNN